MRSVNSGSRYAGARLAAAAAAALALSGCGTFSNEDLRFLAALPTNAELRVAVPAQGTPGGLTACSTRSADVWLWAKPTSDHLNAGVDWVLALVDAVRKVPPTHRGADTREWGPFDDRKHPGMEVHVTMLRTYPVALGGAPEHAYAFEARPKGTAPWTPIISGTFRHASATTGSGTIALFFDNVWQLQIADADSPHGTMRIGYDRTSEPRTTDLSLAQEGFNLVQFDYGWAGYADGQGAFDYAFKDAPGNLLTVAAGFDAGGRGRAQVAFTGALGATGSFRQCWDANACLVYVDDPANLSCPSAPCSLGIVGDCPPVTAPPF